MMNGRAASYSLSRVETASFRNSTAAGKRCQFGLISRQSSHWCRRRSKSSRSGNRTQEIPHSPPHSIGRRPSATLATQRQAGPGPARAHSCRSDACRERRSSSAASDARRHDAGRMTNASRSTPCLRAEILAIRPRSISHLPNSRPPYARQIRLAEQRATARTRPRPAIASQGLKNSWSVVNSPAAGLCAAMIPMGDPLAREPEQ